MKKNTITAFNNKNFGNRLADLWEIRKKSASCLSGTLPVEENIRKEIMEFFSYSRLFDFDKWIWSVVTGIDYETPLFYENFSLGNFHDSVAYLQEYAKHSIQQRDDILRFVELFPNSSVRKFNLIDEKKYRVSSIYREHIMFHHMEDGIISNIKNPKTGYTTFFCIYREDKSRKYFFTQEEEDRHLFVTKILSLSPNYPIVLCDNKGKIFYKDKGINGNNSFLDLCKKEFPSVLKKGKIPPSTLANLISWNPLKLEEVFYHDLVNFKIINYKNLYCIQASPKIICSEENIKTAVPKKIIVNNNYNIQTMTFEEENKTLRTKVSLLEGKVQNLEKEKTDLLERLRAYQESIGEVIKEVVDTPDLVRPPEVAPELFKDKQSKSLDFLEIHYGQYLTYFGAPKDTLFQYQLKKLDPKLYSSVRNRVNYLLKKGQSTHTLAEIIPPMYAETDDLVKQYAQSALVDDDGRLASRIGMRLHTRPN